MSGSDHWSRAEKQRWYGETSPRSQKQFDDYHNLHGATLRSTPVKTVIMDRKTANSSIRSRL